MTVNHGVPGSSPGEGAKATNVGWLFCFRKLFHEFFKQKAHIFCKYPAHLWSVMVYANNFQIICLLDLSTYKYIAIF
jgi:hypothetical protein